MFQSPIKKLKQTNNPLPSKTQTDLNLFSWYLSQAQNSTPLILAFLLNFNPKPSPLPTVLQTQSPHIFTSLIPNLACSHKSQISCSQKFPQPLLFNQWTSSKTINFTYFSHPQLETWSQTTYINCRKLLICKSKGHPTSNRERMEIVPSLNACQKYMRKNIKREKREGERERVWNKVVPSLSAAQYIYLRLQSINLAVSVQSIILKH